MLLVTTPAQLYVTAVIGRYMKKPMQPTAGSVCPSWCACVAAALLFVVCSALCSAGLLDRTGDRSLLEPQLWLAAQPTQPLQVGKVSSYAPEAARTCSFTLVVLRLHCIGRA
jgi:hypothetical protein